MAPLISQLTARAVAAGLGGVGPTVDPLHPREWLMVSFDAVAAGASSGLELASLELVQAGRSFSYALAPIVLRRDLKGGAIFPFDIHRSEHELAAFDGEMQPGQKLRLLAQARLDAQAITRDRAAPLFFRAHLAAPGDPGVWFEGPVETAYCTAGPARPPPR